MNILIIALYVIAAWISLGVIGTILNAGRPRKPISNGQSAFIVVTSVGFTVVLILAAIELAR